MYSESDLDNHIAETMPNQINQSIYLHGFGNHGFSLPQGIWIFIVHKCITRAHAPGGFSYWNPTKPVLLLRPTEWPNSYFQQIPITTRTCPYPLPLINSRYPLLWGIFNFHICVSLAVLNQRGIMSCNFWAVMPILSFQVGKEKDCCS